MHTDSKERHSGSPDDDSGLYKTCFVIGPINNGLADYVYSQIIRVALLATSFKPIRSDEIEDTGSITHQIVKELAESPLVIADLTGSNPNVFFELAIRYATALPVIQIIRKGEKIPFDISDSRVIEYDINYDSKTGEVIGSHKPIEEAQSKVTNFVKQIESKQDPQSLNFVVNAVRLMKSAENFATESQESRLTRIENGIIELSSKLGSIEQGLSDEKFADFDERIVKQFSALKTAIKKNQNIEPVTEVEVKKLIEEIRSVKNRLADVTSVLNDRAGDEFIEETLVTKVDANQEKSEKDLKKELYGCLETVKINSDKIWGMIVQYADMLRSVVDKINVTDEHKVFRPKLVKLLNEGLPHKNKSCVEVVYEYELISILVRDYIEIVSMLKL